MGRFMIISVRESFLPFSIYSSAERPALQPSLRMDQYHRGGPGGRSLSIITPPESTPDEEIEHTHEDPLKASLILTYLSYAGVSHNPTQRITAPSTPLAKLYKSSKGI